MIVLNELTYMYERDTRDFNYEISFFYAPNITNNIEQCEVIVITAWNLSSIPLHELKHLMQFNKKLIIDFSYEMIDINVLEKLLSCDTSLSNVEYYCNDRGRDYALDVISICEDKGLKIVKSQFFIDNQQDFIPQIINVHVTPRKFIMYTGKTRPERTFMVGFLSYYNLIEHGYVSYFGETHNLYYSEKINNVYDLPGVKNNSGLRDIIKTGLDKITIPLKIDTYILDYYKTHSKIFNPIYYNSSEFAVILETDYGDNFFVTEKTIKCIVLNKKFMVLGCVNFVKKLKNYYKNKFNTDISHLTDWCDITYDDEIDFVKRAELIILEVKKQIKENA